MRMRNRMELLPVDSRERQLLADNLLRSLLHGRLPADDQEKLSAADFTSGRFCVLDIDGSAVGTVSLRPLPELPGVWEIRSLAVSKSWQRAGLAQFMFDKVVAAARAQGARRLRALIHSGLPEAAAFFAHNEFRPEKPLPEDVEPEGLYTVVRAL